MAIPEAVLKEIKANPSDFSVEFDKVNKKAIVTRKATGDKYEGDISDTLDIKSPLYKALTEVQN